MKSVPSVSVSYARNGSSTKANALGMRPMQERAYRPPAPETATSPLPPSGSASLHLRTAMAMEATMH